MSLWALPATEAQRPLLPLLIPPAISSTRRPLPTPASSPPTPPPTEPPLPTTTKPESATNAKTPPQPHQLPRSFPYHVPSQPTATLPFPPPPRPPTPDAQAPPRPFRRRPPPRPPSTGPAGQHGAADPKAPHNGGHGTVQKLPHGAVAAAAATAHPAHCPPPPQRDAARSTRAAADSAPTHRNDGARGHGARPPSALYESTASRGRHRPPVTRQAQHLCQPTPQCTAHLDLGRHSGSAALATPPAAATACPSSRASRHAPSDDATRRRLRRAPQSACWHCRNGHGPPWLRTAARQRQAPQARSRLCPAGRL